MIAACRFCCETFVLHEPLAQNFDEDVRLVAGHLATRHFYRCGDLQALSAAVFELAAALVLIGSDSGLLAELIERRRSALLRAIASMGILTGEESAQERAERLRAGAERLAAAADELRRESEHLLQPGPDAAA